MVFVVAWLRVLLRRWARIGTCIVLVPYWLALSLHNKPGWGWSITAGYSLMLTWGCLTCVIAIIECTRTGRGDP